jgi:hypothetical protein
VARKDDIALPTPGTKEPEGKRGQARLGEKPVLPPPKKPIAVGLGEAAPPTTSAGPTVIDTPPPVSDAPAPDLRVRNVPAPGPKPMKRERSRTRSGISKTKKRKRPKAMVMDDEIAVVARDPRRGRED